MRVLITLALITLAACQLNPFLFGDSIHGYRFEYHRREDIILIRNSTACFIVETDKSIEDKLEHKDTREKLEDELYQQIQADKGETVAKLTDLREDYHDTRGLFECFRHKVYKLTYISS